MMRVRRIFAVILVVGISLPSVSWGQDIREVLKKMQDSTTAPEYQGMLTTVFINTPFTQVYRYKIVNYGNSLRKEELLTDGPNKEVSFDDGTNLWRFFPYQNLLIKEKSRMIREGGCGIENELDLLKKSYRIQMVGEYLVNERKGYRISFKPKQADRPEQVYWIDAETGIPFKIEKYGPDNALVSVSSFTQIDFRPSRRGSNPFLMVPPNTSLTEVKEESNLTFEKAKGIMGTRIIHPGYIPPGFLLRDIILRMSGEKKDLQLFYTDGLSSLSVFQSPSGGEDSKPIAHTEKIKLKAGEAYLNVSGTLNMLKIRSTAVSTTLVGEVFKNEIIKVGESLTQVDNEKSQPRRGSPLSAP